MKLNKILKYLVYSIIIVLLLEYTPQKQLPESDIIFMIFTLLLSSIILDVISDKNYFEYFTQNIKKKKSKNNKSEIENSQSNDESEIENSQSNEQQETDEDDQLDTDDEETDEDDELDTDDEEPEIEESKIIKVLKNKISNNEIELLEKNCIEEKKCLNIIKQLFDNNKINQNQMTLLKINYGITHLKNLQSFYQQERLDDDILIEISNMIDTKSLLLVNEILDYYISKNLLSSSDKSNIMKNLDLNDDHNLGRSYLINLYSKINKNDISKIDIECSSDSIDRCSILLNKLKNKNSITEEMHNEILKLYNKPGFIDTTFENNKYAKLDKTKSTQQNNDTKQNKKQENNKIDIKINKSNKFDKESDMNYNIYKNIDPIGKYTDDFNNKFINGNDYLNTDKWRVPVYEPPLCKLEECDECNEDNDYPLNVSQWNNSRKILHRDNINIDYINDNLNS